MLRFGIIATFLVVALIGAGPSSARAEEGITVRGHRAPGGAKEFVWTVTNTGDTPITMFRPTHYLGRVPIPPDGWEEAEMTANVGRKQKLGVGYVEYRAKSPRAAIRPGQSLEFQLRMDLRWTGVTAPTRVTVGLEGGREVEVAGVACPYKVSFFSQYFPVLGLGAVFVIFLGYKLIRARSRPSTPQTDG